MVWKKVKVDVKIFSYKNLYNYVVKQIQMLWIYYFLIDILWYYRITIKENVNKICILTYTSQSKLINTDRLESPITYAFKQGNKIWFKRKGRISLQAIY